MEPLALARLLRLASPALPVGAFSYSQGLEWAVEAGTVRDEATAQAWIRSLLEGGVACFELPVLCTMASHWTQRDLADVRQLNSEYIATRETAELRAETLQMGRALRAALISAGDTDAEVLAGFELLAFPSAFAFATASWEIPIRAAAAAYAFAWVENQVTGAIKLVPLGQGAGQRILACLSYELGHAVETAIRLPVEQWSNFSPLYAIASCRHETQYTRLFRS